MPGADSGVGVGQLCGIHPLGLEVQPGGPFHPLLSPWRTGSEPTPGFPGSREPPGEPLQRWPVTSQRKDSKLQAEETGKGLS